MWLDKQYNSPTLFLFVINVNSVFGVTNKLFNNKSCEIKCNSSYTVTSTKLVKTTFVDGSDTETLILVFPVLTARTRIDILSCSRT